MLDAASAATGTEEDAAADAAAEAERCQQEAQAARKEAARAVAAAGQEAQRLIEAARDQAEALELRACEADERAAAWRAEAGRDARIARLEAELDAAAQTRDVLTAEAARLAGEAGDAAVRLAGLAERRQQAETRRVAARQAADVDGVRDAVAELAAVDEVRVSEESRRERAQARLAQLRGDRGEVASACRMMARAAAELAEVRRERAGMPRRAELVTVAEQLLGVRVAGLLASDPGRLVSAMLTAAEDAARSQAAASRQDADEAARAAAAQMSEAIATAGEVARLHPDAAQQQMPFLVMAAAPVLLPELVEWLEQLAAADTTAYTRVAAAAFGHAPAAEPGPGERAMATAHEVVRELAAMAGGC